MNNGRRGSSRSARVRRAAVWDTMQFALTGIMFVLLGEQLPAVLRGAAASVEQSGHRGAWWLAAYALAITLGLALLRFAWVWTSLQASVEIDLMETRDR